MKKGYFTKEISMILYGIAIILMVCEHLFCYEGRMPGMVSIYKLSNGITIERLLGDFISCVSIYAFVTGYGLCKKAMKVWGKIPDYKNQFVCDWNHVFHSWISFMTRFWLIFLIFVPIGLLFFNNTWTLREIVRNFIGISPSINGEWWYIYFYYKILLVFPFLDLIVTYLTVKFKKEYIITAYIIIMSAAIVCPVTRYSVLTGSFYVFLTGYLCAKLNILDDLTIEKRHVLWAIILPVGIFAFKVLMIEILGLGFIYHKILDFLFIPIFVWSLIQVYDVIPDCLRRLLKLLGKYSVYIWLTHTFFCYYYWQKQIIMLKYSVVIFLAVMVISTITAVLLDTVHRFVWQLITGTKHAQKRGEDEVIG